MLEIVKTLHNVEEMNQTKVPETLQFKKTKPEQNVNFDKPSKIPDKWLTGVTDLQVYITAYKIKE